MAPMSAPDGAPTVVVVGAGITGLSAAHRLLERANETTARPRVLVLEADDRPGGQIRTERRGEFLFEAGPDAIVAHKPAGIGLCERIGLGPHLRRLGSRGAHIVWKGRLHRIPDGFVMMAPTRIAPVLRSRLFTWRGKLRLACEPLVPRRPSSQDDESLASFVSRRFGREVLDRVAEPVIASLFTADADRMSLRLTMPRFLDLESSAGSVTRGLARATAAAPRPFGHGTEAGAFVTVQGGLFRIIEAIAARLPQGSIRTGARVTGLLPSVPRGGWTVRLASGEVLRADGVVLACSAEGAAQALDAVDEELARELWGLRAASCATVNLAYRRDDIGVRLDGYGFFVPRAERLPILACNYVSEKFEGRAPADTAVFRAFLGGATRPDALDAADDELVRQAHATLRPLLDLRGLPIVASVHRAIGAMPQFHVGAARTLARIGDRLRAHRGLFVAGRATGAFGLPDCIRSGEEAADALLDHLALADERASVGVRSAR